MSSRRVKPRWETPIPPGVLDARGNLLAGAGSWGPYVADYARRVLRLELDRWQQRALNRALLYYPSGQLVHRVYLISTGRQNGKTVIARSVLGWALTDRHTPPWEHLYGLAHERAQAFIPYRGVLTDLAPLARRLGPADRGGLTLTRYMGIRSGMYGRAREYRARAAPSGPGCSRRTPASGHQHNLGIVSVGRSADP